MIAMRDEHDALGDMALPDSLDYGIQTVRAKNNFPISGITIADIPGFVKSIAQIKKAAALANLQIGVLESDKARAIILAADEVIAGPKPESFPVDIYHGGGGTSANMNVNEVIGIRANEILTGRKGGGCRPPQYACQYGAVHQ